MEICRILLLLSSLVLVINSTLQSDAFQFWNSLRNSPDSLEFPEYPGFPGFPVSSGPEISRFSRRSAEEAKKTPSNVVLAWKMDYFNPMLRGKRTQQLEQLYTSPQLIPDPSPSDVYRLKPAHLHFLNSMQE
ncbi:uncharacterized protein LOC111711063 isoform X2 [Eurytemora carolleeae]|uniref:uncharacterized protein LOC111711063 isoform X2 n=1 Tax=Eurytemora carolleeae TaxID=1294199 RepID=UPI000C77A56B|nr:uncharacterized protein LOC111711063 isoform X2 [Eurytemora carolleeae]|eukprot:XP_023341077.1 uncharacterized protein LOC111711063 isoform X2 [Eurytemora affinis]